MVYKKKIIAFGSLESDQIFKENDSFVVIYDNFPVSSGHTLIIAKRPVARFSELSKQEKFDLIELVDWAVYYLEKKLKPKPDGFNLGVNDGEAAGQTIEQFHYHVIPRYTGDVTDARGGIRFVIPSKGKYWD
jgi:diadenosine tetraphosphate (Ap4A) HIT family hydrolase